MNTTAQTADDIVNNASVKSYRTHLVNVTPAGVSARWTFWAWVVVAMLLILTVVLSIVGFFIGGVVIVRLVMYKRAWQKQTDYYNQLVAARVAAGHFNQARA